MPVIRRVREDAIQEDHVIIERPAQPAAPSGGSGACSGAALLASEFLLHSMQLPARALQNDVLSSKFAGEITDDAHQPAMTFSEGLNGLIEGSLEAASHGRRQISCTVRISCAGLSIASMIARNGFAKSFSWCAVIGRSRSWKGGAGGCHGAPTKEFEPTFRVMRSHMRSHMQSPRTQRENYSERQHKDRH